MNNLYLSLGSVLVGILATLLVGRYYFRRTVSKSLTPYIQSASSVFRGLDSSLQESLKISYKGTPVDDLLEMQFLIANTGVRAIRNVITPLSLTIPDSCTLLDAAVIYVSPMGRAVKTQTEGKRVVFDFALLNADEFFIVKVLLQGHAKPKEFKFMITVDDLPPILEPKPLPPDLVSDDSRRKFEPPLLIMGLFLLLGGFSIALLIYNAGYVSRSLWQAEPTFVLTQRPFTFAGMLIAVIPCLLCLVVGVILIIGSFTNFSIPKRRKFVVPSYLSKNWFRHESSHLHMYEEDKEPEKETS